MVSIVSCSMSPISIRSFCGGVYQTNGYLVGVGGRHWLFDAPEGITEWLKAEGVHPEALILTHQHHDHVLDVGKIQAAFPCPVYAHSYHSDDLTLSKLLERMTGMPCPVDAYTVDKQLAGQDHLDLGALSLRLFHVPGHSPDSLCFLLGDSGILIGGDVLFADSIGRTDFPNGNHQLLIDGIHEKLWPLPDDTQVLPGHGPATSIGREKLSNPFL